MRKAKTEDLHLHADLIISPIVQYERDARGYGKSTIKKQPAVIFNDGVRLNLADPTWASG